MATRKDRELVARGIKRQIYLDGKPVRTQAGLMGIDRKSLMNYASGKQLPRADMLYRMRDYYGCTMDELLGVDA